MVTEVPSDGTHRIFHYEHALLVSQGKRSFEAIIQASPFEEEREELTNGF